MPDSSYFFNLHSKMNEALRHRRFNDFFESVAMVSELFDDPGQDLIDSDPEKADVFDLVGYGLSAVGNYAESASYYRRSLAIRQHVFGIEHTLVAISFQNLSFLFQQANEQEQAYAYKVEADKILEANKVKLNNQFARLYYEGKYMDAIPVGQELCELEQLLTGNKSLDYCETLSNLAFLYKKIGFDLERPVLYDDAERLYSMAYTIIQPYADSSPDTLGVVLINFGELYRAKGEYVKAEEFLSKALKFWQDKEGEESEKVAGAYNNLASLYQDLNQMKKAEEYFLISIDIRRKVHGDDHLLFAQGLNNIAKLYICQHRNNEAESLFIQALHILGRVLGPNHPEYLRVLSNLIELYEKTGKKANIDKVMEEFVNFSEAVALFQPFKLTELPQFTPIFDSLIKDIAKSDAEYAFPVPFSSETGNVETKDFQEELRKCIQDFSRQHYSNCIRSAMVLNAKAATFEVLQIYLICMQLLSETSDENIKSGLNSLVELTVEQSWIYKLLQLVIGKISLDKVLESASGDAKIFQAQYYAAFRALIESRFENAQGLFTLCDGVNIDVFERRVLSDKGFSYGNIGDKEKHAVISRLNNQVSQYLHVRDFNKAIEAGTNAYEFAQANCDVASRERRVALMNLATGYFLSGDLLNAKKLFVELRDVLTNDAIQDRELFSSVQNSLGVIHLDMGEFMQAEQYLKKALSFFEQSGSFNYPGYGQVLGNLAEVYRERGDFTMAHPFYIRAIKTMKSTLGEEHPEYARWLNNFGILCFQAGYYKKAKRLLAKAFRIRRKKLPREHSEIGSTLSCIAHLCIHSKNYVLAKKCLRKAALIHKKNFGTKHIKYASDLNSLSMVHFYLGETDKAQELLENSIAIMQNILPVEHPFFETLNNNLSLLYNEKGEREKAFSILANTFEIIDVKLGQIFSISSERQQLIVINQMNRTRSLLLSVLLKAKDNLAFVAQAYSLILRRKNISADIHLKQRGALFQNNSALEEKFKHILDLRMKIARKTLSGPGLEGGAHHVRLLQEWVAQKEELEAALATEQPDLNSLKNLRSINVEQIAGALPENAALVEFVYFSDSGSSHIPSGRIDIINRYVAFVLCPQRGKEIVLVDIGKAKEIDDALVSFRGQISKQVGGRHLVASLPDKYERVGKYLTATVFDPIKTAIGNCKKLFIVPDGNIYQLSFSALPGCDGYLLDEYEITYLTSGRDILNFNKRDEIIARESIVIADPNFDLEDMSYSGESMHHDYVGNDSRIPTERERALAIVESNAGQFTFIDKDVNRGCLKFHKLNGTRLEGEALGNLLNVTPFFQNDVLEGKLKACESPYILHIATHGFFLPMADNRKDKHVQAFDTELEQISKRLENPLLRSGLALAGANAWFGKRLLPPMAEDGILTAEDVISLRLEGTEMVVLSACETALGDPTTGEGVFGLQRAFTMAGAKALIMSLWKVPDEQTRDLMVDFYRNLLTGLSKSEALRKAQLFVRERFEHPYYWGAFICQGNPRPLTCDSFHGS